MDHELGLQDDALFLTGTLGLAHLMSLGLQPGESAVAILLQAVGNQGHCDVGLGVNRMQLDELKLLLEEVLGEVDQLLESQVASHDDHVVLLLVSLAGILLLLGGIRGVLGRSLFGGSRSDLLDGVSHCF